MGKINMQERLLLQLAALIDPVKLAATDSIALNKLLRRLGWSVNNMPGFPISELQQLMAQLALVVNDVVTLVQHPPKTIGEIKDCLNVLSDFFSLLKSVETIANSNASVSASLLAEFQSLGNDLLDLLICDYLRLYHPVLYGFLSVIGLVEPQEIHGFSEYIESPASETWNRRPYLRSMTRFDRIGEFLSDPVDYFKNTYFPSSGQISTDAEAKIFSDRFLPRVVILFNALGFYASYGVRQEDQYAYLPDDFAVLSRTLSVRFLPTVQNIDLGAGAFLGQTPNNVYGVFIKLFGGFNFKQQLSDWFLTGKLSVAAPAFSIDEKGVSLPSSLQGSSIAGNVSVFRLFESNDVSQIGSVTESRFEIGSILFDVFMQLSQPDSYYGAVLKLNDVSFFINGGDGFVRRVIPNGINGKFDLSIGWNNKNGLQFGGSGGLEIFLPAHIDLGPVSFRGLKLGLYVDNGDILITAGGTIIATLGPVVVTAENLGLKSELTFPAAGGGNMGAINADLDFKLPNGIGLSLEAGIVKGGGYLYIDPVKGRYVGAVELKIADRFSIGALGIITTKNPDGSDGFSLLVLINVTFEVGLPIGFGFTVNGIGGILGVNRSMNPEAIRNGVKTGAIDRLLFPSDIVDNIQSLVTDLEQIFPIQQRRYTFGLMFIIRWGAPTTLVKIKLGVIIEVPSPIRLAIIGTLALKLPSEEKAIVTINAAFAGIIDFDKKFLTFDATIFDSKLLTFDLFGDIAVRVFWGEHREMLLSVGGFHPAYNPPAYLLLPAKMDRLTIAIFNEDNLKLILSTYFAVTSNTVQLGARLDFLFRISRFRIIGLFGFDVLFQFNPFKFQSDVYATLAVMNGDDELLCVNLQFFIEGPGPWHARGAAEFKVLGIRFKANFDKTWGPKPATTLPDVAVLPLITADLNKTENWQVNLPANRPLTVKVKELPDTSVILHPSGVLSVTQKVAPLGVKLERFGNQRPTDGGTYDITAVAIQGVSQAFASEYDNFAPAQFRDMKDDQKLSAASFEYLKSGVQVKGTDEWYMDSYLTKAVSYDATVIDSVHASKQREASRRKMLNGFVAGGLIGTNPLSRKLNAEIDKPIVSTSFRQEQFQIISSDSLKELSQINVLVGNTVSGSLAEAMTKLDAILLKNPALANKIQVAPVYL